MPTTYGYCRVSTQRQADSGLGLDAQQEQIKRAFDYQPEGRAWGDYFTDPACSASIPFANRQAGFALDQRVVAGDCIIFAKLDRGFRNCLDFFTQMARWQAKGVTVKMLDLGIDTSTPMGEMMAGIMAIFAQFERRRIAERIREAQARRKLDKDARCSRYAPGYGKKPAGKGKKARWVPDAWDLSWIEKIVAQKQAGYTATQIELWLRQQKVRTSAGRPWSVDRVQRVCRWHAAQHKQPPPPQEGT